MSKPAPAPLVRIINRSTRWVRVGDYECGVEYDVTPDVAATLAVRGFARVDPAAPAPVATPATPEE